MPKVREDFVIGHFTGKPKVRLTRYMLIAYKAFTKGYTVKSITAFLEVPESTIYMWIKNFERYIRPDDAFPDQDKLAELDAEVEMRNMRQDALNTYHFNILLGDRQAAKDILEQTMIFRERNVHELAAAKNMSDKELIESFVKNVFNTNSRNLIEILADSIQKCYDEFCSEQNARAELGDKLGNRHQEPPGEIPVVGTD